MIHLDAAFAGKYLRPRDLSEAREMQMRLGGKVRVEPFKGKPSSVAGVDASFSGNMVYAAAALYSYPVLEHLRDSFCAEDAAFPYVPGYLTFREGHAIVRALMGLRPSPGLLLVDGQGIAHPRGIGIASHIGVLLDLPSIGCAKSRLVGEFREPGPRKGDWSYLLSEGRKIGAVLRTREGVKPVFVSPGHRMDITSAIEIVLKCLSGWRLPEPLRRADSESRRLRREEGATVGRSRHI